LRYKDRFRTIAAIAPPSKEHWAGVFDHGWLLARAKAPASDQATRGNTFGDVCGDFVGAEALRASVVGQLGIATSAPDDLWSGRSNQVDAFILKNIANFSDLAEDLAARVHPKPGASAPTTPAAQSRRTLSTPGRVFEKLLTREKPLHSQWAIANRAQ